ncbi:MULTISPECIES: response regulator [Anaerolinea]|uniref:Response regulator receiver protein n=1 Tax=Anaerolinea thermophila (strain DSM 14523 / JCM 11388 / NBRC 100420 / UNI-1) TaxID=926569 RepID=E8N283_ANATU|nr:MULTISPECIES: response regulator [Anaerolinea]BAJ65030.1 response regulator receiver protein [Anaerolinea thermophila UNI-1]
MSEPNRILVIEDNADNLELVRFLLEQAGFQIISAMDGLDGLEKARSLKPDLVLLDMSLPELDGWHLAKQLKESPETAHILIVALTAHTLPGDRRRALEAGCDGFISKPLNVARFASQIQEYLRNNSTD